MDNAKDGSRKKSINEGLSFTNLTVLEWFGTDDDLNNMRFFTDEIGLVSKYIFTKCLRKGLTFDQIAAGLKRKFPDYDIDGFIETEIMRFRNKMEAIVLKSYYGESVLVVPTRPINLPACEDCIALEESYHHGVPLQEVEHVFPAHPRCRHSWLPKVVISPSAPKAAAASVAAEKHEANDLTIQASDTTITMAAV